MRGVRTLSDSIVGIIKERRKIHINTLMAIAKAGSIILSSEKGRKVIGWIIAAILSPLILLVAFLCCLGFGMAEHNTRMVDYCFYDVSYDGEMPAEFESQMESMQTAFSSLDSAVDAVNDIAEADGLDSIQIKAIYCVLCSDGEVDTDSFVSCFYTLEERTQIMTTTNEDGEEVETEESYTVSVPCSIDTTYQQLGAFLGRDITEEEKEAIQSICLRGADPGAEAAR